MDFTNKHACPYNSDKPLVTLFASMLGYGRLDVSRVASSCMESNKNIDGVTERYVVALEHRDAERSRSVSE